MIERDDITSSPVDDDGIGQPEPTPRIGVGMRAFLLLSLSAATAIASCPTLDHWTTVSLEPQ